MPGSDASTGLPGHGLLINLGSALWFPGEYTSLGGWPGPQDSSTDQQPGDLQYQLLLMTIGKEPTSFLK